MLNTLLRISIIALINSNIISLTLADDVYRIETADGSVSYTSKPPSQGAKPAKLPEITKGEFKIADSNKKSCEKHGGIDCSKGQDSDGSVICNDGFVDASARFIFSCSGPKLVISDILPPSDKGEIKVFVRNLKSVKAEKPSLLLKLGEEKVVIPVPNEIEPFGMAEFAVILDESRRLDTAPKESDLILDCTNCG